MKRNIGSQPAIYPMPVLIIATYGKDGPDAMNAAWGGMCGDDLISLCLTETHKTYKNIVERGAFTVNIANVDNLKAADYVGVVSGNKVKDKIAAAGWTLTKSAFVDAPIIDQLPISIECKLYAIDKTTDCVIGKIVNVAVEESVMTDGKVDAAKVRPIVFDTFRGEYVALGDVVGKAFSVGLELKK